MKKTQDTRSTSGQSGAWATNLWQRLTARQIKWRLTLAYVSLIYFSMTAIGLYLSSSVETQFRSELYKILQSHARLVRNVVQDDIENTGLPKDYGEICRQYAQQIHARVQILDNENRVLGDSERPDKMGVSLIERSEQEKRLESSFGCRWCHPEVRSNQSIGATEKLFYKGHQIGTARVSSSLFGVKRASARIRRLIFATLIMAALIAAIVSHKLAANIANPISEMNSMARKIAGGDLNQRVPAGSMDEVGELANSFNVMANQLQKMVGEMSEEKNKMETILTTMADGIIVTDEKGSVVLFNKASERIFERKAPEVTGKKVGDIGLHPLIDEMVSETLLLMKLVRRDIKINGNPEIVLRAYCSPVRDSNSQVKGTVMVLNDLTEIRQHEKVQKDFVANVSHELRTPITAIRVTAEALMSGAKNDPKLLERFLESLVRESDRLSFLIDDLLEIAKREAGRVRVSKADVNLKDITHRILSLYNTDIKNSNLGVVLDVPENVTTYIDERQLEQVLQNLISNAIKYTPENGKISISASMDENWTTVSVSDTGIGIPQCDVNRIFERFYRVDKARSRQMGGTGLGLSIVKDIVESYGGTISVSTQIGEGSTFTFTIPTRSNVQQTDVAQSSVSASS